MGAKPNDLESTGALITAAAGKCSVDGTAEAKDWVIGECIDAVADVVADHSMVST